jgi:hypothetical protein
MIITLSVISSPICTAAAFVIRTKHPIESAASASSFTYVIHNNKSPFESFMLLQRRKRRVVQKQHSTYLRANTDDANERNDDFDDNTENRDETTNSERQQQNEDTRNNEIHDMDDHPQILLLEQRVAQLQQLVSAQQIQIRHLLRNVQKLEEITEAFADVMNLLQQAGLQMQKLNPDDNLLSSSSSFTPTIEPKTSESASPKIDTTESPQKDRSSSSMDEGIVAEAIIGNGSSIFGTAPSTVLDAADSAGAAILAGVLAGKLRMLVDVRDAELNFDHSAETMVQFLELAVLPVAAGLEGLQSSIRRNRLKIVFPTVSQLLAYRKHMALSAPDVVALSTLGFDPVEEQRDNLIVVLAPAPDDDEGLRALHDLLTSDKRSITQPLVVLNHHMLPLTGPAAKFEVAYHLRLLSVHYNTGGDSKKGEFFDDDNEIDFQLENKEISAENKEISAIATPPFGIDEEAIINTTATTASYYDPVIEDIRMTDENAFAENTTILLKTKKDVEKAAYQAAAVRKEAAIEAALKHAYEGGAQYHGVTRAMVIRAYPRPWHVFVDTSPDDLEADFQVAATFDVEPTTEQVNQAIIECLEGSEKEDELVAQQMQQALELGQLDRVSQILTNLGLGDLDDDAEDDDDEDDEFYQYMIGEDSV